MLVSNASTPSTRAAILDPVNDRSLHAKFPAPPNNVVNDSTGDANTAVFSTDGGHRCPSWPALCAWSGIVVASRRTGCWAITRRMDPKQKPDAGISKEPDRTATVAWTGIDCIEKVGVINARERNSPGVTP